MMQIEHFLLRFWPDILFALFEVFKATYCNVLHCKQLHLAARNRTGEEINTGLASIFAKPHMDSCQVQYCFEYNRKL